MVLRLCAVFWAFERAVGEANRPCGCGARGERVFFCTPTRGKSGGVKNGPLVVLWKSRLGVSAWG